MFADTSGSTMSLGSMLTLAVRNMSLYVTTVNGIFTGQTTLLTFEAVLCISIDICEK